MSPFVSIIRTTSPGPGSLVIVTAPCAPAATARAAATGEDSAVRERAQTACLEAGVVRDAARLAAPLADDAILHVTSMPAI